MEHIEQSLLLMSLQCHNMCSFPFSPLSLSEVDCLPGFHDAPSRISTKHWSTNFRMNMKCDMGVLLSRLAVTLYIDCYCFLYVDGASWSQASFRSYHVQGVEAS